MNKYTKTWKDLNKKTPLLEREVAPIWFYIVFIGTCISLALTFNF